MGYVAEPTIEQAHIRIDCWYPNMQIEPVHIYMSNDDAAIDVGRHLARDPMFFRVTVLNRAINCMYLDVTGRAVLPVMPLCRS
jgi:hypothetical protein